MRLVILDSVQAVGRVTTSCPPATENLPRVFLLAQQNAHDTCMQGGSAGAVCAGQL
jgi:hypothetical protein